MPRQSLAPTHHTVQCQVCKKPKPLNAVIAAELVRRPIIELIQKEHSDWSADGFICFADLNHYRGEYFEDLLTADVGELTTLENEVIESLKQEEDHITTNINVEFDRRLTFGERVADRMAEFGGSWSFILTFTAILIGWITLNTISLLWRPFDPYPYILLNLVLSCLAAIQAPVIMMSQNRQEAKDRMRSQHDYQVNLKAELEIRHLHEKIDHLLSHQWDRMIQIQEIQLDILSELRYRK